MVDSEESGVSIGHLIDIAEDNEYFKKMCSLVPPLVMAEVETDEEEEETILSESELRQMKKEKRKEKKRKKEEKETNVNDAQKMTKKHKHEEDVKDNTSVKPKKQKVKHEAEPLPVNNELHSSDSEMSSEAEKFSPKPNNIPKQVYNKPVKHVKEKHHAKKIAIKKESEKNTVEISTVVNNTDVVQSVLEGATNLMSEGDVLQAASINSIEDKREKLRAKIAELQAKRNPSNKERLEKKKLKRQESKMKLKQKRKLEKMQNKQNSLSGLGSKPAKGNLNKGPTTPAKPVYNKEGQMVFSKFDFTDSAKKEKRQSDLHGKDYKRLLEKIEKRNEKIKKVKSRDEGAGKALEDKFKWESVLHKAEGEKVKDNPELLKKALKQKQKMKEQRKKKWENRMENVEKLKEDRQKKRTENIQKRKQNMKDKKLKQLKKKGRILPGF